MTKKEYLENIGYVCKYWDGEEIPELLYKGYKASDGSEDMTMYINWKEKRYLIHAGIIENQRQIDDLQIAFNNVKRDFEEMQKYD